MHKSPMFMHKSPDGAFSIRERAATVQGVTALGLFFFCSPVYTVEDTLDGNYINAVVF